MRCYVFTKLRLIVHKQQNSVKAKNAKIHGLEIASKYPENAVWRFAGGLGSF
jgi:hypothetical protein